MDNEANQIQQDNNQSSILNNDSNLLINRLYTLVRDVIPAFLLISLTSLSLNQKTQCNPIIPFLLRIYFFFGLIYLIKSILSLYLYSSSSNSLYYKISKSTNFILNNIISISYYIYILFSYMKYNQIENNTECLKSNYFPSIVLFSIITLGIIDICYNIIYIVGTMIGFPCFIRYFLSDPMDFISRYGIDPTVIDEWPIEKATEKQNDICVICNDPITVGQDILILKCDARHYFHGVCIKRWLKEKIVCPLCKSKHIL